MWNTEMSKFLAIKSGAELYRIFFRLVQLFSALGILYFLLFFLPFVLSMGVIPEMARVVNPMFLAGPLGVSFGQMVLAEIGLRATERKRFSGVILGLVLAVILLPSVYFPFALFGLFCFLNPSFQREHLGQSPEGFRNFLSAMNCNWIEAVEGEQAR